MPAGMGPQSWRPGGQGVHGTWEGMTREEGLLWKGVKGNEGRVPGVEKGL